MIKYIYQIILIFILFLLLAAGGCKMKKENDREDDTMNQVFLDSGEVEKSREMISTRSLGLAYLEENKLDEAEIEFKKLIQLAPDEALGYANLGIVYMRMGKYQEAEEQLKKAIEINPDDPDIRFNLAKVYDLANNEEASREELEKSIELSPDHVQTLYGLAESYQDQSDSYSISQWEKYLRRIVETSPANLVARLYLVEALVRNQQGDEALKNLEEIERITPQLPDEASDYFNSAVSQLRSEELSDALTSVRILHNLLKLTNAYQTDIQQLKGTSASRVGTPVISFSETRPAFLTEGESLLDALRFTDVTTSAGLDALASLEELQTSDSYFSTHMAIGDMDRDGDEDLYVSGYDIGKGEFLHFLMKNNMGRYQNIAREAGIRHNGTESEAIFADYDNDGFLDLYITRQGRNLLYGNVSEGVFQDVSANAGVGDPGNGNHVLFFDIDQEGDLDLLLANQNSTKVYLNNGDKTFRDITGDIAFGNNESGTRDAVFGDIDDDGDVDVFMIDENGVNQLFMNMRDRNFTNVTGKSGLQNKGGSRKTAMGDYNNDGFPDLFILGDENQPCLYMNQGDGTFTPDQSSGSVFSVLDATLGHDVIFFDFDNDGFIDILTVGESRLPDGRGIYLFHNENQGGFKDVSDLLPEGIQGGTQAVVTDYNEDGDMDIFLAGIKGGIRLLRNDGGNANHHLKIQLVGIRTGSGKNNYFGIGAKVEVRAGELYQMKTVTTPNVHFGLGSHEKVDVVRILWTNGVPQNIFSPGSDQDLIEEQELKGSCPFLYTWNGEKYEFLKDMMWRSALGMPLGIMGEENAYAFADASVEYLKIPGEFLKARDGKYSLQVTSELWETIYFDKVRLIAIDHPDAVDIYVDEKFSGPPFPELKIYQVDQQYLPRSVSDGNGLDLTPFIRQKDNQYISNFSKLKYQGLTEMHDLIIDLGDIRQTDHLYLFLNGWIFPTDASINVGLSQSAKWKVKPPSLEVLNKNGKWEMAIENIGFPMGKNKTVIVDLSGKDYREISRVRIRTNMEIYWDHIFYSTRLSSGADQNKILTPVGADLHFRGFSEKYRKGGRYGPHWFKYEEVTIQPKWRDLSGNYTRYGDVLPLVLESDNQYVIMNAGDEMTLEFDAESLPLLPDGWKRDFLIFSVGWVKDGDLNTAHGNTVDPLPYHGMKSYPYSTMDRYPSTFELETYQRKYNTRAVSNEAFRNEIRQAKK